MHLELLTVVSVVRPMALQVQGLTTLYPGEDSGNDDGIVRPARSKVADAIVILVVGENDPFQNPPQIAVRRCGRGAHLGAFGRWMIFQVVFDYPVRETRPLR